jgi:hypothetical protein
MWSFLREADQRRAVEVAEAFADDRCGPAELAQAKNRAWGAYCKLAKEHITKGRPQDRESSHAQLAAHAVGWVAHKDARGAARTCKGNLQWIETGQDQSRLVCDWLRDLFGNPFRQSVIGPDCLAWNDGTVPRIARAIYDERAFERMPILADALEDAGCGDADILRHCREPGEHVRGCWVIDLLLGKE